MGPLKETYLSFWGIWTKLDPAASASGLQSDWTSANFKDRKEIFFALVLSNGKSIILLSKIWLQIALHENERFRLIKVFTLQTLFSGGVSQVWFEAFKWKVELFSPFKVKRKVIYWHSNSSPCGLLQRHQMCMQEHKWPYVEFILSHAQVPATLTN